MKNRYKDMTEEQLDDEEKKILETMCRKLSAITAVKICRNDCKEMTEEQLAEDEENAYKGYTEKQLEVYEQYKGMTEKRLAKEATTLSSDKGIGWGPLLIRFSVLVSLYFRRKAEK